MAEEGNFRPVYIFEMVFLVILAIIVDIVQIILDVLLVGALVNRIIDICFGLLLLLWTFVMNRVNTRILGLTLATFVGEEIPIVDLLPLWTLEVLYVIVGINRGTIKTYTRDEVKSVEGAKQISVDMIKEAEKTAQKVASKVPGAEGTVPSAGDATKKLTGAAGTGAGKAATGVGSSAATTATDGIKRIEKTDPSTMKGAAKTPDVEAGKSRISASENTATAVTRGTRDAELATPTTEKPIDGIRKRTGDEVSEYEKSPQDKSDFKWSKEYEKMKEENPGMPDDQIRNKVEAAKISKKREVPQKGTDSAERKGNPSSNEPTQSEPENTNEHEPQDGGSALDTLNNKPNRTLTDNQKLTQASEIMKRGSISDKDKRDPVLKDAWDKHNNGIREFNPVSNPNGYKFSNNKIVRAGGATPEELQLAKDNGYSSSNLNPGGIDQ